MTGHFEAKKHAYRQTQDGIVVSFVIHPNDLDAGFAIAPLGTRYMVAFAVIGENEGPVAQRSAAGNSTPAAESVVERARDAGASPAGAVQSKDRRPFASLPLSQQAAIRCSDHKFQEWLEGTSHILEASEEAAAAYVRHTCSVSSRSQITDGSIAGGVWREIEAQFKAHLTDCQYADARR